MVSGSLTGGWQAPPHGATHPIRISSRRLARRRAAAVNRHERRAAAAARGPGAALRAKADQLLAAGADHFRAGRLGEAEAACRRALMADPGHADALNLLGVIDYRSGHHEHAAELLARAVAAKPSSAEAHNNHGNVLNGLGRFAEAEAACRRALEIRPGYPEAQLNLGNALQGAGRYEEAEGACRKAVALMPNRAEAHYNLGNVLGALGLLDDAVAAYARALDLDPDYRDALVNLANLHQARGRVGEAEALLRRAVCLAPDFAEAHNNLGNALKSQGRLAEAEASYGRALELKPGYREAESNRLFALLYDDELGAAEVAAAFKGWGAAAARRAGPAAAHGNEADPERRLRLGYVSPDFRRHAMAYYLEPLLAAHDRRAVSVHCYAEVSAPDEVSGRFQALAEGWVRTVGMSDAMLAARIREDGIDILVDLAGHTAGNRLALFALKPAPVQVATLVALGQTTGLAAIDYVLTNARLSPAGSEAQFAERLQRLPGGVLSFQPSPAWPEVTPLPAASRGHLTFASFNDPARISPSALALWSEVLRAVPDGRLLLKHRSLVDDGVRGRLEAAFASEGVAERVELRGVERGWAAEMGVYEEVDLALDTCPVNGGTSSCIALWMGLPVVTLVGAAMHQRFGREFVAELGHGEWAVESGPAYVALAAELAGDLERLAGLRRELRPRMAASALMDHAGRARDIEAAYREIWRRWCAGRPDAP